MAMHYLDPNDEPRACPCGIGEAKLLGGGLRITCADCMGTGRIGNADGPRVRIERWAKTGGWHYALPYVPTKEDRRRYPRSYPKGDEGPFYRNADCGPCGFETAAAALAAARLAHHEAHGSPHAPLAAAREAHAHREACRIRSDSPA